MVLPRSWLYIALPWALLTVGCASSAERDGLGSLSVNTPPGSYLLRSRTELESRVLGPIALNLDSALPVVQSSEESLLAGSLALGGTGGPLRYRASYSLMPGEIVRAGQIPQTTPPRGLGEQLIEQQAMLELLEVAGAPLALSYSHARTDHWTTEAGFEPRREVTSLRWAPDFAEFDLRWAGPGSGFVDSDLALDCDVTGDLQLPLAAPDSLGRSYLRLSGRGCGVDDAGPRFAGLGVSTYGLTYGWQWAGRESRLELAAIDPEWRGVPAGPSAQPSYELSLTQTMHREAWSTSFKAARRQHASDAAAAHAETANWMARVELTRELPAFSVSASWERGHDPLWFAPEPGSPADQLGLAMGFSRWAETVMPHWSPEFSLSWRWERDWAAEAASGDDQVLRLDMSAFF